MAKLGGVSQVDGNENSQKMENLARFAVDEHKKKENTMLEFRKVLNAKQQVVSGIMYYITLEAMDGDKLKIYQAKVWEKPWMNFKELQDLKFIGDAPAVCTATA